MIGGESAGAHLSAVTLIRMRDKHGFLGFSRANLTFGAYDLASGTPSVARSSEDQLVLNRHAIEWFTAQFVADANQRRDPDISPMWADLHDLPAALFTIGTLDPLVDDSLFMYARWVAAGRPAELAIYPGGAHGFVSFPYPLAQRANERIFQFLRT